MSSTLKCNIYQDANGNALFSSDGSGNVTLSAGAMQNTPSFFAVKTTDQTVTTNTYTKITFDTERIDTNSAFSSSTFTVPSGEGGKYFISATAWGDANAVTELHYGNIWIYKNGSGSGMPNTIMDSRNNYSYQFSLQVSCILNLSAGDYLEIYARLHDQAGSPTFLGLGSTLDATYFYGYKLIGA